MGSEVTSGTLAELIRDLTAGAADQPGVSENISENVSGTVAAVPEDKLDTELDTELDAETFAQLDQLLAEPLLPSPEPSSQSHSPHWSLGIDLGMTGLSAVLLDQTTYQLYPLYWQESDSPDAKRQFRLSTATPVRPTATSPTASPLSTLRQAEPNTGHNSDWMLLSDWKPYLNIAIPHHSPQTSQWEPVLQWSESQQLSLRTIQEVLQQLFLSLNASLNASPDCSSSLVCNALGLEAAAFQAVWQNLSSVVLGYPGSASDTYSFNLREAVLQAGLVQRPEQILFVEEAIAGLLSALPAANGQRLTLAAQINRDQTSHQGHLHNANWQGCTLVLTAGASLTELLLVKLPAQIPTLNHMDFYLRGLPYAGEGLDQDIICQLFAPRLAMPSEDKIDSQLQADFATELAIPEDLLARLNLPNVAEPDLQNRRLLQQRLTDSQVGQQLLNAARALKITLQYQPHCYLKLGDRLLRFEQSELTSRVLLPYVQRLNRDLNALLAQTNSTVETVNQVICTGGTASLNAITRWLRQKLPKATIIQDSYAQPSPSSAANFSVADFDHSISSCSRIAYGLATLPLHPQVIDQSRHCYSDYFLLQTLLQTMPPQPLPLEEILTLLDQRGIDTQLCRLRILALLEGQLPPGLVPSRSDMELLTAESAANPDYQAICLAPLFHRSAERHYAPNRPQWDYLQRYLATLLTDADQRLDQPLLMPAVALRIAPT